ncbi:helix-turn-helix domain-containing protein [Solibacillus merdavium]|nr:helix-turn-helix domain-containing protein [Solibacillus merdavium]
MDKFFNQLYVQFEQRLLAAILKVLNEKLSREVASSTEEWNEWMDLKTAAKYLGVSPNTFYNFRVRGLKVVEIDNVKRVSKTELDRFMKKHSK